VNALTEYPSCDMTERCLGGVRVASERLGGRLLENTKFVETNGPSDLAFASDDPLQSEGDGDLVGRAPYPPGPS